MRIDRRLIRGPTPVRPRRQINLSLGGFRFWLGISAFGILGSLLVLLVQLLSYARTLDRLPPGQVVAGVPVGGLTRAEAEARLNQVYGSPLLLDYRGSPIRLDPAVLNYQLDTAAMLSQASGPQPSPELWPGFWAYLWNDLPAAPEPVPLKATYDQSLLTDFLADVAGRYNDPGLPPRANPDTLGFTPGSAGHGLDLDEALSQVNVALRSPAARTVALPVRDIARAEPTFETLADLLRADVGLFQFTGTVSIYVADLDSDKVLNIAIHDGKPIDVGEGIAYSAMSTIKIPVMVTFYRYRDGPPTSDETLLLQGVFAESANAYTDLLLGLLGQGSGLIGANRVSDTMADLGLKNTYLAGLLDTLGAITTARNTPGNSRPDINLSPDRYNQTAAPDMGRLLVMIYHCSRGGGQLMETFPGRFTADECQQMIELLEENAVGPIFVAGGSPGARVAHKHGWDLLPLNNVGDAALVFSPGGDYAMSVYVHRAEPVPFDQANRLIISLATAVFNYYNRR